MHIVNILHMKYAVEIAKAGSINKASEVLLIAQPNLSRSVKELENNLGITIFDRSSKGMELTSDGEVFINYAQKILQQIDEMEAMYKSNAPTKQRFSLAAPRTSYISQAFAAFSRTLSNDPAELIYQETNSQQAINSILQHDYHLGIIRYASQYNKYFEELLASKNICGEVIVEFKLMLLFSEDSPLAKLSEINSRDLADLIEVSHADPFVPSLTTATVRREQQLPNVNRHIFVYDRSAGYNILSDNPSTFMFVSNVPAKHLSATRMTQRPCTDLARLYKDVLIRRKDYVLTEMDKRFITELCRCKRECFSIN